MAGILLFYALYPFSRYLSRRRTAVDGRTVWDGGTLPIRNSQSDPTLQNPRGETMEDPKERQEPGLKKDHDSNLCTDKESLQQDTKTDANTSEMQSNGGVDYLKQEDGEVETHQKSLHATQDTEDKSTSLTEEISPQDVLAQFEFQQTEDGVQEVIGPASSLLTYSEEVQASHAEESQTPVKTAFRVSECWDEYLDLTGDVSIDAAEKSEFLSASFLSRTKMCPNVDEQRDAQASWHFPAGPGLAQEVRCSRWQFPAASYYPPVESAVPFEVKWRIWEDLDQHAAEPESVLIPFPFKKASVDFTVMSYNILAQDLLEANIHLYVHCPLEVLDWNYRCSLLLKEIESWTPDILCLQEVQENHYNERLCPDLSQMGYTCVYKRRTGNKTDGCAICYRSTCFAEVALTKLEFYRPETELLDRHNVGIVLLLQPLVVQEQGVEETGPLLCVANTHLLFNPRRGDVKLAQLAMMLAEIKAVVKSCKTKGKHCNVVLCGDFNSLPHRPLYNLITTSELYYQGLPAWMISGQEDLLFKPTCHRLSAPLWPSSLGVTDDCQYTRHKHHVFKSQNQKSGKRQYTRELMLQRRYYPAACVRPPNLVKISGVTDVKPCVSRDDEQKDQQSFNQFGQILRHQLDLESVYKHVLPGSGSPEITTLHSEGGATVDYVFYSPKRVTASHEKGEGLKLTGFLSLLSEDVLWSLNGLPNHMFPSDHLSLVARFQMNINTL